MTENPHHVDQPPAGLGRRAAAVLLDSLLVTLVIAMPLAALTGEVSTNPTLPDGQEAIAGISLTLTDGQWGLVLLVGLLYAIVTEATLGATLGKLAVGLRVRRRDGSKLGWGGASVRNIVRVVDAFPYIVPYVLGWLVALTDTRARRRVGDRAAGSIVVRS